MSDEAPHLPTTWDTVVGYLAPGDYTLTRWTILRLLGVVHVFAFLGLVLQGPALFGSHGLTPAAEYVAHLHAAGKSFRDVPSLFLYGCSDRALTVWAYAGLALALACAAGYANLPSLVALWVIYGSFERVGGATVDLAGHVHATWFAFGWEMQLCETTLLAAFLAHPWDPRPLAARPPPATAIVLMRWLVFRVMLGAGLIKWRGDPCWHALTCLDHHFETQPIPNPLSAWFHHLPHAVHAAGVVFNHAVELVAPWFVFGPRRARLVAGAAMAMFQVVLIASGNLAFLNWLTLVPILACFDDRALLAVLPGRARRWVAARLPARSARDGRQLGVALAAGLWLLLVYACFADSATWLVALVAATVPVALAIRWAVRPGARLDGHQLAIGLFAVLVAWRSAPVIDNLTSSHQVMNASFDPFELVNTYGAFGSVGSVRHELVIEGTMAADPHAPDAEWRAYELPCKPGDVTRRPCVLGPYHLRLDWMIWFSAMDPQPEDPWIVHLVWKLLDGDRTVRELFAVDPFDGQAPRWVRIRRFVYHLQPLGAPTWWTRDSEELWLPPVSRDTPGLAAVLARYGWQR